MNALLVGNAGSSALAVVTAEASLTAFADLDDQTISAVERYGYDLVVFDLGPGRAGLIRGLRVRGTTARIVVLLSSDHPRDRADYLRAGADECVSKPISSEEFRARIRAVMRRGRSAEATIVSTGDMTINLDQQTVTVKGVLVPLTAKQFQMMEILARRKGATVSRQMFLEFLYGGLDHPEVKILDVFMTKIRKKIAYFADGVDYIETVWGRGYMLKQIEERVGSPPLVPSDPFLQMRAKIVALSDPTL